MHFSAYTHYLLAGFGFVDFGLLLNRLIVGTFFAISGYHKLFNAARHETLVKTLVECRVPFIGFNQWFVPAVELASGLGVVSGLLAPLAGAGMLAILVVAILTDGRKRINTYAPFLDTADYVCDVLYLPEILYGGMAWIVIAAGPGKYSLYGVMVWLWPNLFS